jgi:sortase A
MNPDQPQDPASSGQSQSPPQGQPNDQQAAQREAAANLIRGQIDSLYAGPEPVPAAEPVAAAPAPQAVTDDPNPYNRTHVQTPLPQADQWQQYHSAWQNYYQKYYEAYYTQQVAEPTEHQYFGKEVPQAEPAPETISQDEALYDLRHQLLDKVQASAKKVRRSRHFIPIMAAIIVVLVFVFLQYNSFITGTVMAYVSPGTVDVQNIVVDPNDTVAVTQDPRLIIPKINVDVPVLYDVGSDYDSQMAAMQKGVAQFSIPGADAHPGQVGNTAIAGHSSNDLLDPGDYKFIFAQLDKLAAGDTIYANYNGIRYTYVVTKTQVVAPTDVSVLQYSGSKPILTLITCTPLGTSRNRLLVTAEQVTPDPSAAQAAPTTGGSSATTIPGANAPSIFQKLFGSNG